MGLNGGGYKGEVSSPFSTRGLSRKALARRCEESIPQRWVSEQAFRGNAGAEYNKAPKGPREP